MRKPVLLAAVAMMVVLAGCAGAGPGSTTAPTDDEPDATSTDTDRTDDDGDQMGTVAFYISDDPNDMDDFRHLNVTVTEVQFHYAGAENDSADDNETTATETTVVTTSAAGTSEEETEEPDETETEEPEDEGEAESADEEDGDESAEDGQATWITRDINDTTVDLTTLEGANATLLDNLSMPAGEYTQVRLVVDEINGTLTDGSDQRVKLPSERLKLTKPFTLGPDQSVDFVFDITVRKAGNSGKYILQPVAGESGTDQEIERDDD